MFPEQKTATAVAYCKRGRGLIKVNGCPIELLEPAILRVKTFEPVLLLGTARFSNVDIRVRVRGGGYTSQVRKWRVRSAFFFVGDSSLGVGEILQSTFSLQGRTLLLCTYGFVRTVQRWQGVLIVLCDCQRLPRVRTTLLCRFNLFSNCCTYCFDAVVVRVYTDLRDPPGYREGDRGLLPKVRGRGFQARDQGASHGVRP